MLALLRGLHLVGLLAAFGTLFFAAVLAPEPLRPRLVRHGRIAALAALLIGAAWLAVEARQLSESGSLVDAMFAAVTYARFGQLLGLRLLLLAAAIGISAIPRLGRWPAPALACVAVALQGALGHAGAAEGTAAIGLIGSEAMHLIAAGAWLGSLLPLFICLRALPPHEARLTAEGFTPIGMTAVLVIAGTAFVQSLALIGSVPALIGTDYGRAALAKLALFLLLLALAAWNRLSLTDRLDGADPARARRLLIGSVATEALCGAAVVLTAGLLASRVPGLHQPVVWPFAWRPSGAVLADEDWRREIAIACMLMGVGFALIALSWLRRRARILDGLIAIGLIGWQAPTLKLLLVEAYPTSFQTSPTGFSADSIARGKAVFDTNCVACHGAGGQGDGPSAAGMRIKPADLTAGHLWDHWDGELFWWISHGMENPDGGLSMPGFSTSLSDDDIWSAIDYARALNAGASMRVSGSWTHPTPAPDLPISCTDGTADRLSDLRGQFVRVVTTEATPKVPDGVVPLRLNQAARSAPPMVGCASASANGWDVFAILAGAAPSALSGTEFLIDPQGMLRAWAREPNWRDPDVLSTLMRTLRDQPVTADFGGTHVHGR